ncbi:MAG: hypothetical protein QF413_09705 [Dehalococcoidia bacterium]|nr:hypothetical protein [Chloroflexota bacterium]MDP7213936.1 hypothetical protein [Dehalococcoidia bacterium]
MSLVPANSGLEISFDIAVGVVAEERRYIGIVAEEGVERRARKLDRRYHDIMVMAVFRPETDQRAVSMALIWEIALPMFSSELANDRRA